MVSMTLIVACLGGLLLLVALIVGIIVIMQSGQRDTVSSARQGWMDSGTDKENPPSEGR